MGAGPPKASTRLHINVDINGIRGSRNIHRMGEGKARLSFTAVRVLLHS